MSAGSCFSAVLATLVYCALALMPDAAYERTIGRSPSRHVRVVLRVVAAVVVISLIAGIVIFATMPVKA